MSDGIKIKVDGLKELEQSLLALNNKVAGKVLSQSLGASAKVVANECKKNLPEAAAEQYRLYGGEIVSKGWLKDQIITKRIKNTESSAQTIVTFKDIYHAFFWKFLEFGSSKMEANPFMRRSFEQAKEKALEQFKEKLSQSINKAITK